MFPTDPIRDCCGVSEVLCLVDDFCLRLAGSLALLAHMVTRLSSHEGLTYHDGECPNNSQRHNL